MNDMIHSALIVHRQRAAEVARNAERARVRALPLNAPASRVRGARSERLSAALQLPAPSRRVLIEPCPQCA